MTKEAFIHALRHVRPPEGKILWLYGDAQYARGDVYTPYHDQVQALRQRRCNAESDSTALGTGYDAVYINCPKQREETEGLIALALQRSSGFVMAVAANDAGGHRLAKVFAAHGIEVQQLSKNHCRTVWTTQAKQAHPETIKNGLALLELRKLEAEGRGWWTVPGLFGWNKLDEGSRLLVEHLPADSAGKAADFGCGFGYLSAMLEAKCPNVFSIDAYDVDRRAITATSRNCGTKVNAIWQDMHELEPRPDYDMVVMNPPFHNGKEEDIGLGEIFIRKAWASLKTGGQLFMVANRNLPYEQSVPELKIIFAGQGYKIMAGRK